MIGCGPWANQASPEQEAHQVQGVYRAGGHRLTRYGATNARHSPVLLLGLLLGWCHAGEWVRDMLRIITISRSERRKLGLRSQGGDVVLTGGTGPSVGGSIEDAFAVNVARGHRM